MSEIKILDKGYVGDSTNLEGIRITFSKSVEFPLRKKTIELIKVALEKLKRKQIFDIVRKEFKDILILHQNEFSNYSKNTSKISKHWGSELDLSRVEGVYIPKNKTIMFTSYTISKNPKEFIKTVIHEIGHAIHDSCLSPSAKKFFDNTSDTLLSFIHNFKKLNASLEESISQTDTKIFQEYLSSYLKTFLLNKIIPEQQNIVKSLEHHESSLANIVPKEIEDIKLLVEEDLSYQRQRSWIKHQKESLENYEVSITDIIYGITDHLVKQVFGSVFLYCSVIEEFTISEEQYENYKSAVSTSYERVITKHLNKLITDIEKSGIKELESMIKTKYSDLQQSNEALTQKNKVVGIMKTASDLSEYIFDLFPSKYSTKNYTETFAECFLYWVLGADNLKMFDKYRMQYTMSISKAGGKQLKMDNYLRSYIEILLEKKSL